MLANRIFTAVLTGCLVLLTVTGCPAGNQAREGGSVQQGSQTGSAAESDFERIMAMFSDEDRALLEADGLIDENFVNNFVADGYAVAGLALAGKDLRRLVGTVNPSL